MKKTLIISTSIAGILVIGVFVFRLMAGTTPGTGGVQTLSQPSTGQDLVTFRSSDLMDFSIQIPREYEVMEKFGSATIVTKEGEIRISQNGTNFDNLSDHIKTLEELNRVSFEKLEDLIINGLQAQVGRIEGEKIYFIYSKYNVYSISTKKTGLFDDLDQIAQSFRYTP